MDNTIATVEDLESIQRLTKDLKKASLTLSNDEARFLVDSYYIMQENRIRSASQVRELNKSGEPHEVLEWLFGQSSTMEKQIGRALDAYSDSMPIGRWAKSIHGIGHVISAGLMAHIDIEKSPTVGHIWSFAGLTNETAWMGGAAAEKSVQAFINPDKTVNFDQVLTIAKNLKCSPKWLSRRIFRVITEKDIPFRGLESVSDEAYVEVMLDGLTPTMKDVVKALSKRPWNPNLKTLCWKIGESFVFVKGSDKDFYGKIFNQRKIIETMKNKDGEYKDQAEAISKKLPNHKQIKTYNSGILPDGHIHERAKRYTVKMFLSHWHHVAYYERYGKEPPKPYILEHVEGHVHWTPPPNYDR